MDGKNKGKRGKLSNEKYKKSNRRCSVNSYNDALCDYSVDQMVGDDYEPTEKCIIAERIIDRIALYDDVWPEWDGS